MHVRIVPIRPFPCNSVGLECDAVNVEVVGSNPAVGDYFFKYVVPYSKKYLFMYYELDCFTYIGHLRIFTINFIYYTHIYRLYINFKPS